MTITNHQQQAPLILTDEQITKHAVEALIRRRACIGQQAPRNPRRTIRKMARKATEERPTGELLWRWIRNGEKARYFRTKDGWRLVMVDDCLVTIERTNRLQNP